LDNSGEAGTLHIGILYELVLFTIGQLAAEGIPAGFLNVVQEPGSAVTVAGQKQSIFKTYRIRAMYNGRE
jgi:hypothetical protein